MSELAISLPRIKRLRPPPKALRRKMAECLVWAAWTALVVISALKHPGAFSYIWNTIFVLLYGRWMIRSYRELVRMIEAWLDEKIVKDKEPKSTIWFVVMGPLLIWAAINVLH